jgi:hypothetical protein
MVMMLTIAPASRPAGFATTMTSIAAEQEMLLAFALSPAAATAVDLSLLEYDAIE